MYIIKLAGQTVCNISEQIYKKIDKVISDLNDNDEDIRFKLVYSKDEKDGIESFSDAVSCIELAYCNF